MSYRTRNLNQKLVYWANPVNDGTGTYTFDSPIQIMGRWEDYIEVIQSKLGEQIISKAKVYVDRPVKEHEYLLRGDISTYIDSNPLEVDADEIKKYEEIPNIKNTEVSARARM